jgi:two-component system, OmpR family, response regulator
MDITANGSTRYHSKVSLDDVPARILLVEDDAKLARLTVEYLESNGFLVVACRTGTEAVSASFHEAFDVILLDLNLPGLDGVDVCRRIRLRSNAPIIMVTARGEEADRVLGLESGADDYMIKPFSSRELLARIRAHLRRYRGSSSTTGIVHCGRLVLDASKLTALLDDRDVGLTAYEFSILSALAERAGQVLSREQLLVLAKGGAEDTFDRAIDVAISRLRAKLGDNPKRPQILKTVRGVGYVLALERLR